MSTLENVRKEIFDLTTQLVEVGLCIDQNFPATRSYVGTDGSVTELNISGVSEISTALRQRPYAEIYSQFREKRAYNVLLIDGAILQLKYRFQEDVLLKHVLAFFPSPNLLEYQSNPEIYEIDLLYADAISKDLVTTPIRFDFDEKAFEEVHHPKSHFTIGQYKNCRIPVVGAITPFRFINFVLRSFYNTPYRAYCEAWQGSAEDFPISVTDLEKEYLHLSFS